MIPGSNKPLSAVARVPLPNPQPVHVYLMSPSGDTEGGGQGANEQMLGLLGPQDRAVQGQTPAWATEEPGAMRVVVGLLWLLVLVGSSQARGSCPSQCSCSLYILGDGSKARYGIRCMGWVAQPPSLYQLGWVGRVGCRALRVWPSKISVSLAFETQG